MNRLRDPGGCPWDAKQTPATIKRYIIEEAYEAVDAVEGGDPAHICEELGDLFFQIVFMARIFEEQGKFNIFDVIAGIATKMIRRHPHIFGDVTVQDAEEVKRNWDQIKATEKQGQPKKSILDDVPRFIPPLERARLLTEAVAKVGFDWSAPAEIVAKLEEEVNELKVELARQNLSRIGAEIGDLLLVMVNLARFLKIDPDESLRGALKRFVFRFQHIESACQGRELKSVPVEEMERYWQDAKKFETAE
jgi:MazG family protein